MIVKIKNILGKNKFTKFKLFLFANIINFFLEFTSLISIPIFVASILSPELVFEKLTKLFNILDISNNQLTIDNIVSASAILVVLSFYLKNFFLSFIIYREKKFYKNFNTSLSKIFFDYYMAMPYLKHTKKNPSELVRATLQDVRQTSSYLDFLSIMARDIVALLVILIIMVTVNFLNAILIFSFFSILILFYFSVMKPKIRNWGKLNQEISSKIIKSLYESYGSIKDIKILSKEQEVKSKFYEKINKYQTNLFFWDLSNKYPKIILEVISISLILLISYIYYYIYKDTQTLFNLLSVYVVLVIRFIPAFNSLTTSFGYLRIFSPSVEFIEKELNNINKEKNIKSLTTFETLDKQYSSEFIKINNLSFRYPNSKLKSLENISLKIEKGSIVGIMGSTGSGKTTFFHLLLGLVNPEKGNIFFKGKSIFANIDLWRKETGHISQNIFLLDDTIKNNITFNLSNSEDDATRLKEAIEIAQLNEKLVSLPKGLETRVGVDGLELSGGERQRIAIARTLYKNPNIIFMDEFTSALDSETEKKILDKLITQKRDKTIIIISHRPSTLEFCDTKFILEKGSIKKVN